MNYPTNPYNLLYLYSNNINRVLLVCHPNPPLEKKGYERDDIVLINKCVKKGIIESLRIFLVYHGMSMNIGVPDGTLCHIYKPSMKKFTYSGPCKVDFKVKT